MILIDAQWLGYFAATLTTGSFVPQAWHTFRSNNLAGISVGMYSAFTAGVALWLVYGLMLGAWPIIVANTITLGLAATILVRTLRARRAARR
ncbi:MAG: hypothetical protein CFE45_20105 [Burkholderiales bacterium PBB5]|jgi:MtN3 and saliva related transmembrane protein|nr:MAG: hypothetical protein CFE45_20105 [Burkholderiales bacterium PBB5]